MQQEKAFHVAVMHDAGEWTPPPRVSLLYVDAGESTSPERKASRIGLHEHNHWQIELMIAGSGTVRLPGRNVTLAHGQLVVLPPCSQHAFVFFHPRQSWSLKFEVKGLPHDLPPKRLPDGTPGVALLCSAVFGVFSAFAMRPIPVHEYGALEYLLGALLAAAYPVNREGERDPPAWFVSTREMIARKCPESLTAAELAKEVGYSRGHLSRLFKGYNGVSLKAFYDTERAVIASRKILYSKKRMKTIAAEVGFRDVYVFSKFMKRVTGMTPTEHRHRT